MSPYEWQCHHPLTPHLTYVTPHLLCPCKGKGNKANAGITTTHAAHGLISPLAQSVWAAAPYASHQTAASILYGNTATHSLDLRELHRVVVRRRCWRQLGLGGWASLPRDTYLEVRSVPAVPMFARGRRLHPTGPAAGRRARAGT